MNTHTPTQVEDFEIIAASEEADKEKEAEEEKVSVCSMQVPYIYIYTCSRKILWAQLFMKSSQSTSEIIMVLHCIIHVHRAGTFLVLILD